MPEDETEQDVSRWSATRKTKVLRRPPSLPTSFHFPRMLIQEDRRHVNRTQFPWTPDTLDSRGLQIGGGDGRERLRKAGESLERNRRYEGSPGLTFRYERLQRRVNLRQQVFTPLSKSYEQAKIDEVRNTPVITVVEPPELPARPDPWRLKLKGLLGLILGGIVGVFWAFGREMMATSGERDPDDYAEFARLKEETKEDVGGLWSRFRPAVAQS